MDESRRKLYEAVSRDFGDTGTYEQFSQKLDDPASRKKLYDAMSGTYGDIGSFQDFEGKVGMDLSGVTGGAKTSRPSPMQSAGQNIADIWTKPGESINRGLSQLTSNPIAGGLNILSGAAQTALAPVSTLATAVNSVPEGEALRFPPTRAAQLALGAADRTFGAVGEFAGGHFREGIKPLVRPLLGEQAANEIAEPWGELGSLATQTATGSMLGSAVVKAPPFVGRGMRGAADRLMGSALQEGGTLARAKELSRFANEQGITMTPKGSVKAQNIIQSIQYDINEGIINPLTSNGMFVKRTPIIDAMKRMKEEMSKTELSPDPAALKAIDRQIATLEEGLANSGEYMTPRMAQDFKVKNNQILSKYYDKRSQLYGGVKQGAKSEGIAQQTSALRSQLEEMHPELRGLNWQEGVGLEVKKAIDTYVLKRYKGELPISAPGWTSMARGSASGLTAFSAYDLLGSRAFRSKLAVAIDKAGRGLTGEAKRGVKRLRNPVKPNPPSKGLLPPWSGSPVGEGTRSAQVPFYQGGPTGSELNVTTGPQPFVPGEFTDVFGVRRKH